MSNDEQRYEVEDASAGTSDPSKKFREMDIPEDQLEEIEHTREERLDPENRPENAEINNSNRTFDPARGEFTDSPESTGSPD